jgi:hypothetical protein
VLFVLLVVLVSWLAFGRHLLHSGPRAPQYPTSGEVESDVAESSTINGNVKRVNCMQTTPTTWQCTVYFADGHAVAEHATWNRTERVLGVSN